MSFRRDLFVSLSNGWSRRGVVVTITATAGLFDRRKRRGGNVVIIIDEESPSLFRRRFVAELIAPHEQIFEVGSTAGVEGAGFELEEDG